MVSRSHWKNVERQTMTRLGGTRFPSQGTEFKDGDDGEAGWLTIEHKTRQSMPAWLLKAFAQSDGNHGREPTRLPLVVVALATGIPGKKIQRFYMMRESYFEEWFGNANNT